MGPLAHYSGGSQNQLALLGRKKRGPTEFFSVEDLRANVPASAMVNPYINRLV